MAQNTDIEWAFHTNNLWHGCTEVHEGCYNCYAAAMAKRFGNDLWGNDKPRKLIKSAWKDLEKFQRLARKACEKHRVFVGSMMDIFEKPMQLIGGDDAFQTTEDLRQRLFENISRGLYPNLQFLLLTKRPGNINKYIPESWKTEPPSNVMFGTSPVNGATADRLIPQLLQVNGRRFLSVEPQLEAVDLTPFLKGGGIHWVIQGGESGPKRRRFEVAWAYQMAGDCQQYRVPYFFKQIDKVRPIPEDLLIREFPLEEMGSTATYLSRQAKPILEK